MVNKGSREIACIFVDPKKATGEYTEINVKFKLDIFSTEKSLIFIGSQLKLVHNKAFYN